MTYTTQRTSTTAVLESLSIQGTIDNALDWLRSHTPRTSPNETLSMVSAQIKTGEKKREEPAKTTAKAAAKTAKATPQAAQASRQEQRAASVRAQKAANVSMKASHRR